MDDYRFDTNNYEFNTSSKVAVYILHGFSSTTYEVRKLAEFLGDKGYHVIAKNLPGHGTSVEECNRVKYVDWLDAVKKDIAMLSSKSDKIFVIGNSMGGVLSLYLASIFPINGFVAAGAVLKFRDFFRTNFLVPLVCRIKKTQLKIKLNKPTKQTKFYGYNQYPLVALNEYRKMIKHVIPNFKKIICPGLIIHSHADRMSLRENVHIIKKHVKSNNLQTVFVNYAHHNMFDDNKDQEIIFDEILNFINNL